MNEIQNKILSVMTDSSLKGKKRLSPIDLGKKLDLAQRELKYEVKSLIDQQKLAYWHSGSGTYLMLIKDYDSLNKIEESN
jgi:hypothetical protein